MATIKKQSIYGAMSSYLGTGLGLLNKFILFPIVFANAQAYWGLLEFFLYVSMIVGALGSLGIPVVFQRLIPGSSKQTTRQVTGFGNVVLSAGFILSLLFLFTQTSLIVGQANDPALFKEFYDAFVMMSLSMILWEWGNGLLIAEARAHVAVIWNTVIQRVLVLAVLVLTLVLDLPISNFMYAYAGVYSITSIAPLLIEWRLLPQGFSLKPFEQRREAIHFGAISFLNRASTMMTTYLDILLGGMLLPMASLPILGMAKYANTVLLIPGRAMSKGTIREVSKAWKINDIEKLEYFYQRTAHSGLAIGLMLFSAIWILLDHIILYLPHGFEALNEVVLITSIGVLFNLGTGVNGHIINLSDFYKLNLWTNLSILVVGALLNYLLISQYGLLGAATGLSVVNMLNNITKGVIIYTKTKLTPFTDRMLAPIIAFGVLVVGKSIWAGNIFSTAILITLWVLAVYIVFIRLNNIPEVAGWKKRFLPK